MATRETRASTRKKAASARKTKPSSSPKKRRAKRGRPPKNSNEVGGRDAILAAAIEVFSESGYHGASIDDVCERAGFTKPSLYHHFRSKEALMASVLKQIGARWIVEMELAVSAQRPEGGKRLDRMMRRWTRLVKEERDLLWLPIIGAIELAHDAPEIRRAVERIWNDAEDSIVDGLEKSIGFQVPDARPLASAVVALLQAAAIKYHTDKNVERLRRNLKETRDVLVLLAKSRFDPSMLSIPDLPNTNR